MRLLRNMGQERALRMFQKLRERRERSEQEEKKRSPSKGSSGKFCGDRWAE